MSVKHDDGKPLAGLVLQDFSRALEAVVGVGTFGAKKYTKHGWLNVPDGNDRYMDAFYRHMLAYGKKDYVDLESGHQHLAHAVWNLLAVLELQERETDAWHTEEKF